MRLTQFLRTFVSKCTREGSALENLGAETPSPSQRTCWSLPHGCRHHLLPHKTPWFRHLFATLAAVLSLSSLRPDRILHRREKKKAPCLLFSQVPRWGTRAAQCSHLRLPSWTVALKQEGFQRRPIPTVDVRTGRLRLFQRQRENWWQWGLKTGQGGKLRIRSLI